MSIQSQQPLTSLPSGASTTRLQLISHRLCPYVQRVAIALAEKGMAFERIDIDLANKPQWFLDVSPLGKTPVLLVDGQAIFESSVICEYLEETHAPRLHPADPLVRAQHRAWMEFASATLQAVSGLYNAADDASLQAKAQDLHAKFAQVEARLSQVCLSGADPAGPFFAGPQFSLVDAAFAPVFRYFDVLDPVVELGIFAALPHVSAWRAALRVRPSVVGAVGPDYAERLRAFLLNRRSALSARMLGEPVLA